MSNTDVFSLERYPLYKESGIPWLGQVPEHWKVIPNKSVMKLRKTSVGEHFAEYTLLSLTKQGVIPRNLDEPTGKFPESFDTYQAVEPGDLIFCLFDVDETPRTIGVAKQKGMVTGAYTRFVCTNETTREFTYLFYLSLDDQKALKPLYTGLRKVITKESFLAAKIALPPLDEQTAIVRYLDDADQRIRAYVSAKERLIALLEEERQAVIHQAVTKGLDPNVKLKPSGVEWLGDVPGHWSLRRLRSLVSIKTGGQDTINRQDNGEYPFYVRSQTVERIDTWSYDGEAVLTAGDGVGVGKVFHYAKGKFDYHQRVYKFSDFKDVLGKFFFHYFRTALKNEVFQGTAKSTVDSLRLPMLQNFPVTIPPTPEQSAIVQHLEKMNTDMDVAMDRARRQIELMEEYRTRLIADVVTGKMDVR